MSVAGAATAGAATGGSGGSLRADAAAIETARQALAKANTAVAVDRRSSPGCVAGDQKLADQAALKLAQAQSAARTDGLDIVV